MQRDGADKGYEFDVNTWAAIVAGVSIGGPHLHHAALDFHQGPPPPEPKELAK